MNKNIKVLTAVLFVCLVFLCKISNAQTEERKTETFKVYGNCEMCQERIEDALKKKDGIFKKEWSTKTKMLTVIYDPAKITLTQIKQKIADVGHDTEEIQAKDETYYNLHKCCQYKRYIKAG